MFPLSNKPICTVTVLAVLIRETPTGGVLADELVGRRFLRPALMAILCMTSEIERLVYWGGEFLGKAFLICCLRNREVFRYVAAVLCGGGAECYRHFSEVV
jgi:hypothetical protein